MSDARNLWLAATQELNACAEMSDEYWAKLLEAYCAPTRFYHTIKHIDKMAESIDNFAPTASLALRFAILYHDVVYDSKSAKNEEDSAALASDVMRDLGCTEALLEQTARMILCTKKHIPVSTNADDESALLLDLDLLILGSSATEYAEYTQNVRHEYAWVPEDQFVNGRAAILRTFLARDFIFFCPTIRSEFEASARVNLSEELRRLDFAGQS